MRANCKRRKPGAMIGDSFLPNEDAYCPLCGHTFITQSIRPRCSKCNRPAKFGKPPQEEEGDTTWPVKSQTSTTLHGSAA
jgi:hypothetical protein